MKSLFILTSALLFTANVLAAKNDPLWMRYPAISPNGETIAFTYKGDIYTVPANGGKATQLTTHPAHDTRPDLVARRQTRSRSLPTGTETSMCSSWTWKEAAPTQLTATLGKRISGNVQRCNDTCPLFGRDPAGCERQPVPFFRAVRHRSTRIGTQGRVPAAYLPRWPWKA